VKREHAIIGGIAGLAALALLATGKDDEEQQNEPEVGERPQVGFAPSTEDCLQAEPEVIDVEAWEKSEPTIGSFYQVRRGDMMLGHGKKSITWMALKNAAFYLARESGESKKEADKYARELANNPSMRCDYAILILTSAFNDDIYGTWGFGARSFAGPHGRSIPLETCHNDNRERMFNGQAPVRQVAVCTPLEKGTGAALVTGLCRPFLWLPMLNLKSLADREVTTRDVVWPGDERISGLEPPPEFWRMG